VDGLDYMVGTHYLDASFIPVDLPRSMRVVVSVAHGSLADALAARGYHVHDMAPLETACKRQIVLAMFDEKPPRQRLVDALVAWPGGATPRTCAWQPSSHGSRARCLRRSKT
jgi:hypothetical protein